MKATKDNQTMSPDTLPERNSFRAHQRAWADELGCFYSGKAAPLCGMDGLFDLYYFHSQSVADEFARRFGGWVLETTAGEIWRASIRLDDRDAR